MIPGLPNFISIFFVFVTIGTMILFYQVLKGSSDKKSEKSVPFILALLTAWLIVQAVLSLKGVYYTTLTDLPPKLLIFGILPPVLLIIVLLITKKGRRFMDALPLKQLTYLSSIRIFVEIGLFVLYLHKAVPKVMTFEGGNLDILSGLSAPVMIYLVFQKKTLGSGAILIWNFVCLALLFNIVTRAILSTPLSIQQFAFDQPNIAILHFPFIWLPALIVPLVLFSHVTAIRKLILKKETI